MRKFFLPVLAAASTIALTAQALPMEAGGARPVFMALQQLDLTDAQRSEIRRVLLSHRGEVAGRREAARAVLTQFVSLDPGAPRYEAQLQELTDTVAQRTESRILRLGGLQQEVLRILTPAQRQQLPQMIRSANIDRYSSGGAGRIIALADQLELADDQVVALRDIRQQAQAEAGGRREHLRDQLVRLVSLDPDAADYDARVQALAAEFRESAAGGALRAAGIQRQIFAVLRPEQRSKLLTLVETSDFRSLRQSSL